HLAFATGLLAVTALGAGIRTNGLLRCRIASRKMALLLTGGSSCGPHSGGETSRRRGGFPQQNLLVGPNCQRRDRVWLVCGQHVLAFWPGSHVSASARQLVLGRRFARDCHNSCNHHPCLLANSQTALAVRRLAVVPGFLAAGDRLDAGGR